MVPLEVSERKKLNVILLFAGYTGCLVTRGNKMVRVHHGDAVPRRENGTCRNCRCNNGLFDCSAPDDSDVMCTRSDPQDDEAPRNCMMEGGEMVMHNEQSMVSQT